MRNRPENGVDDTSSFSKYVREFKYKVKKFSPHYHKLEVIVGDILKVEWPTFNVLVANLPYQVKDAKILIKLDFIAVCIQVAPS